MDSVAASHPVVVARHPPTRGQQPASPAAEARLFGRGVLSCFYWEEVGVTGFIRELGADLPALSSASAAAVRAPMAEARQQVIVNHSHGLHEGIKSPKPGLKRRDLRHEWSLEYSDWVHIARTSGAVSIRPEGARRR